MKTKADKLELIKAAMGEIPCDKTIVNVRHVNVFTGEILKAEVDIYKGYVISVRTGNEPSLQKAKEIIDGEGLYMIPGYVDTHMHIESTMLLPENFARVSIPWGTTCINHDPHEIGNVLGIDGIRFMIDNGKKTPQRQYAMASSCVPAAVGLENAGASFDAKQISELLDLENVTAVAEIMDFVGVIRGSKRMHDIIEAGEQKHAFLQGHASGLAGNGLDAYAISGIQSNHECSTSEQVIDRLRRGMYTDLKSSSLVDNFSTLLKALDKTKYHDRVSFCTDDVHVADLLKIGHMNNLVRQAVQYGIDPIDALRMATINGAREEGLRDVGAIAPGYHADFQLVEKIDGELPCKVFINGELIAQNGKYLGDPYVKEASFENSMHTSWITSKEDLMLKSEKEGKVKVNVMVPLDAVNIIRKVEEMEFEVKDSYVSIEGKEDLAYVCVINRHGLHNKTIALMKGFGLKKGAVASTVSHDSHNLIIVYTDPQDAFLALKELEKVGGGMALVCEGQIRNIVPFPIAGLMSDKDAKEVNDELIAYRKAYYEMVREDANLQSVSLMSLTAILGVIVTDLGLVDGATQTFIPIFA
ncbi:MAG: adenine deaminase [Erysipelotrichaceae bacterium]|nr:adenine deaminase [Erysipelotrichaceae bacterium]